MDAQRDGRAKTRQETKQARWGSLLKGLLAVHVARSALRVSEQRARVPEAGRLGGSVAAAWRAEPRPAATPADPEPEIQPTVPTQPLLIARKVFAEFGRDNGTLLAAAVAFYLLLAIIPLVLIGVSILGYFIKDQDRVVQQVFLFLNQFLPIGKQTIRPIIEGVIQERGSLGIAGLLGLAFTATGGFATLENAVNILWNRPNRNFLMNKVYAFGMMLVVGLLFLLTVTLTWSVQLAGRISGLEWLESSWMKPVLSTLIPLFLSSLMFTLIYRYYPNGRTGWRAPLVSGAITGVLWEAFKHGYAFYASHDRSPYGVIVGLVMWVFYSAALILLGSELTWVLEGCPGQEGKEEVHAQRDRQRKPGEAV